MALSSTSAGHANTRRCLVRKGLKNTTLKNIVFRKKNKKIINLTKIHKANTVFVTFILQKNQSYYETVTQHTNSSKTHNPVII